MTLKNIFSLLALGLALASCSSEDAIIQDVEKTDLQTIGFSTYNEAISRGTLIDSDTLKKDGFYVYANVNTLGESTVSPLMAEQKINWDGAKWVYSPVKYWPTSANATVDFYAIHKDKNTKVEYDWNYLPQVTFMVNPVVSEQTDYIWAKPLLGQKRSAANDSVQFNFKHALTAYAFSFVTAAKYDNIDTLKINSITLSGYFAPKATINPQETDITKIWKLQGDWDIRSYTISTENGGIDPDRNYNVYNINGKGTFVVKDDGKPGEVTTYYENTNVGYRDYIMLLPYKNVNTYTLTMNYTIITKDESTTPATYVPQTYEVTKEFTIKGVKADDNLAGKLISTRITLQLDEIKISGSVSDWDKSTSGTINIPE